MRIFYSGEENKSLPELVLFGRLGEKPDVMLTYWLHGKGKNPTSRFRNLRRARKLEQLEREDNENQS